MFMSYDDIKLFEKEEKKVHGATTSAKLKEELGDLKEFKNFDDKKWLQLGRFFKEFNATGAVFAPGAIRAFWEFSSKKFFPVTRRYAEEMGFKTKRYDTKSLLTVLYKANLLTKYKVSPDEVLKIANHSKRDVVNSKRAPDKMISIYSFNEDYMDAAYSLFKKLGIAEGMDFMGKDLISDSVEITGGSIRESVAFCNNAIDEILGEAKKRHEADYEPRHTPKESTETMKDTYERYQRWYDKDAPAHFTKVYAHRDKIEDWLHQHHGNGDWFKNMSKEAQKKYLDAHPDSRYASGHKK